MLQLRNPSRFPNQPVDPLVDLYQSLHLNSASTTSISLLHLDHWSILHPVNLQSSQESIPLSLRQTNPQVDGKSRDLALHQASEQAPLPGGPVQVSQTSWKELSHLP